jgi:hypothetical protein
MRHSIICRSRSKTCDPSLGGIQVLDADPVAPEFADEPCCLTNDDTYFFEDDDDPEDECRPDRRVGFGLRWSEARPYEFWTYYDRFVRYFPKKKFNVKYAYDKGFIEKKRRHGDGRALPLFESLAIEMTERHLDAEGWADWKKSSQRHPIWLGLHMPKSSTVDCLDIDAKKYLLGYYRTSESSPRKPVVHLPLDHFKLLKRVYDQFPGRVWCISSETLGIHAWRKHDRPRPTDRLHQENKDLLAAIGHAEIESHPMQGRCLRRPFGADYRTITPAGIVTHWIEQLEYFEDDGRTPPFSAICQAMLDAMLYQWAEWEKSGPSGKVHPRVVLGGYRDEVREVEQWLANGCPGDPVSIPVVSTSAPDLSLEKTDDDPIQKLSQAILLGTFGEISSDSLDSMLSEVTATTRTAGGSGLPRPRAQNKRDDVAALRGGKWVKELLRLARGGLEREDSVATVIHEMAKWLWWIELSSLPEESRRAEIIRLLTEFVLKKHNGCITRLQNGHRQDVINQISRCLDLAARISDSKSLKGFAKTRDKWLNGGYKYPIRITPELIGSKSSLFVGSLRSLDNGSTDGAAIRETSLEEKPEATLLAEEDVSSSLSCQFTFMCINFDEPLPDSVQSRIMSKSGRNKILPFATRLLNRLYSKQGSEYLGRPTLLELLGYKNPTQVSKYLTILEEAGVIKRGSSYSAGRNGKLITLDQEVISEMQVARDANNSETRY